VIERLAPIPVKPQGVIVERWLPYAQVKRRVVFTRPCCPEPRVVIPRNVIVQWEAPRVNVRQCVKYLGVVRANPAEYVSRYAGALMDSSELPKFVTDIATPHGLTLAADSQRNESSDSEDDCVENGKKSLVKKKVVHELFGDLDALALIEDLDSVGLGEYKSQVPLKQQRKIGNKKLKEQDECEEEETEDKCEDEDQDQDEVEDQKEDCEEDEGVEEDNNNNNSDSNNNSGDDDDGRVKVVPIDADLLLEKIDQVFESLEMRERYDGKIGVDEAGAILLRLNARLGREVSEAESRELFKRLEARSDKATGLLELDEFKRALFVNLI
jgi:hypothetical protein